MQGKAMSRIEDKIGAGRRMEVGMKLKGHDPRNSLSYWYPLLRAAGFPVPRTEIVRTRWPLISWLLDQQMSDAELGKYKSFLRGLSKKADAIGYPCFLRTGHTSAKHQWKDTCYIADRDQIPKAVLNLVEFSSMVTPSLPCDVWAVRELLPTTPVAYSRRGMPLCREFRVFASSGAVHCMHPYWPLDAIRKELGSDCGKVADAIFDELSLISHVYVRTIRSMAEDVSRKLTGSWSVDFLETHRGWYVIDCAMAADSYHYEGCEWKAKFSGE